MISLKKQLQTLICNGQLRRLPANQWHRLTNEEIRQLLDDGRKNPPGTYSPATLEQKNYLSSYIAQGLLPGIFQSDIKSLTEKEAEFYIECAEYRRWGNPEKSYFEYLEQTFRHIAPAAPHQLSQIVELGRQGHLNRLSTNTLLKLSHLSANRLIWRGNMNQRERSYASYGKRA